jgi:hypothetical protein
MLQSRLGCSLNPDADFGLHVARGAVDVAGDCELQLDARAAERGSRR